MAELPAKRKEGRPLLFANAEALETKANQYFKLCEKESKIPLLGELAVFLDCSRQTLADYKQMDEFSYSIQRIKSKCEAGIERQLVAKETYTPGQLAILKNGYGWSDNSSINHTGQIETPSSVAVIEAMGAFANLLQQSAKAKLVEGEVIDG